MFPHYKYSFVHFQCSIFTKNLVRTHNCYTLLLNFYEHLHVDTNFYRVLSIIWHFIQMNITLIYYRYYVIFMSMTLTSLNDGHVCQYPHIIFSFIDIVHRENTRREESKYLECENRQLGLIAIAEYIFKPPTEKFKIGR